MLRIELAISGDLKALRAHLLVSPRVWHVLPKRVFSPNLRDIQLREINKTELIGTKPLLVCVFTMRNFQRQIVGRYQRWKRISENTHRVVLTKDEVQQTQ